MDSSETTSSSQLKSRLLLLTAYVACSGLLYVRDLGIKGPFIFYDEAIYFQLARHIWEQFSYVGSTDYNPLYPFLIAPFFASKAATTSYHLVRVLNCLLWASGLFPLFWLATRWLGGKWMPLALAVAAVFMPLSADVPLVRAEPLFFPLFYFSVWFGLRMLLEDQPGAGFRAGISCGLLFLTKQGGLALVLGIGITSFVCWCQERRPFSRIRTAAAFGGGFLLVAFPWMIRNRLAGGSAVGYGLWINKMLAFGFSVRLFQSIAVNLTYVFVVLGGGLLVLYMFSLFEIHLLSRQEQVLGYFSLSVLLAELLICGLITLVIPESEGRTPYFPVGRYMENVFPLLCLFSLRVARNKPDLLRQKLAITAIIWAIGCLAVFYCSPLQAVVAKSAGDNPALAFLVPLFASTGGEWWALPRLVTPLQAATLSLGIWALIVPFLLLGRQRALAGFICSASILSGWFAKRDLFDTSTAVLDENKACIWLVKQHVQRAQFAVDSALNPQVSPFAFWFRGAFFEHPVNVLSPSDARLPLYFDTHFLKNFSGHHDQLSSAQWSQEAIFNPARGYGFLPSDVNALMGDKSCGLSNGQSDSPCIVGHHDSLFRIILPSQGRYKVTIDAGSPLERRSLRAKFAVIVGDRDWEIEPDTQLLQPRASAQPVAEPPQELDIALRPAPNATWVLRSIEVERAVNPGPNQVHYYVSSAGLPLPVAYSSGAMNVYKLRELPAKAFAEASVEQLQFAVDTRVTAPQDSPLTVFSQQLQSSVKSLTLRPQEITWVPVTVSNTGDQPWGVAGKYPIRLSYEWLLNGKTLPSGGFRTPLLRGLAAGESEELRAEVQAPDRPGKYLLRFSMVQEAVAWFYSSGGALTIPVLVQ